MNDLWKRRRSMIARGLYLEAPPMHGPVGPDAETVARVRAQEPGSIADSGRRYQNAMARLVAKEETAEPDETPCEWLRLLAVDVCGSDAPINVGLSFSLNMYTVRRYVGGGCECIWVSYEDVVAAKGLTGAALFRLRERIREALVPEPVAQAPDVQAMPEGWEWCGDGVSVLYPPHAARDRCNHLASAYPHGRWIVYATVSAEAVVAAEGKATDLESAKAAAWAKVVELGLNEPEVVLPDGWRWERSPNIAGVLQLRDSEDKYLGSCRGNSWKPRFETNAHKRRGSESSPEAAKRALLKAALDARADQND